MAHFLGKLKGQRKEVTKLGTKYSGVYSVLNGWDFGVRTELYYDEETNSDQFRVFSTGGSNNNIAILVYDSKKEL